jgi:hypothetical protein
MKLECIYYHTTTDMSVGSGLRVGLKLRGLGTGGLHICIPEHIAIQLELEEP